MSEFRSQGAPDDGASGPKTIKADCGDSIRQGRGGGKVSIVSLVSALRPAAIVANPKSSF